MYLSDFVPRVGMSQAAALLFSTDRRRRFRLHLQAFALLSPLTAVTLAPLDAQAACSPATGDNVTVTCSGATVDQGPGINTGYGNGAQNGLTLNVQSAASVTGTSTGIDVNSNNTINNSGTITTHGSGGVGDVYGISGEGNNLTVVNSGTIGRFDIPNFVFDAAAIFAPGTGISITNNLGATIQGQEGIQGAGTGIIVNSGLITGLTTFGGGVGIDFSANNTAMVTVTNNSTGVINGDAFGINANSAVVYNYGTISAPTAGGGGTGLNANTLILTNYSSGLITGDAFGVSGSQTPNLTITNFGTISSTGFAGIAIQGNTVDITNSGSITSAAASAGAAISTNSGTITNNAGGTISGDSAIQAFGNTSIFNAGTITGLTGTAISFFSGGNTLTLGPGSVINGTAQGFGADTFQLGGTGTDTFNASLFATQYSGYSTFNKIGSSTWTLTGTGGSQAWNINAGTLVAGHQSGGIIDALGTGDITMNGGTLRSAVTGTFTNNLVFSTNTSSVVSAAAGQTLTFGPNGGASFVTFADGSTATFGSTTDTGTIIFSSDFNNISSTAAIVVAGGILRDGNGVLGNATGNAGSTTVNAGATLDMNDQTDAIHNLLGAGTVITGTSAATTLFLLNGNNNGSFDTNLFAGVIKGPGSVEIGPVTPAGGATILTGTNLYTGGTFIQDTTILQLGNNTATGSILGNVTFRPLGINGPNPGMLIFDRSNTYQFDGTISGPGVVVQAGSGTTILTANNTYTGATNVNGGVLDVEGSIAASGLTSVNTGAVLTGTGTVGNTMIASGGMLAPGSGTPGTSFNVSGNLAFQSGALYLVSVNPATSSFTHVTGTATLNGATVDALFAPGAYVSKTYTILNANGGVSGTFNPSVPTNMPNLSASLSYDANDVFLNLQLNFSVPGGLNGNQQAVGNALTNFFNTSGGIPFAFVGLTPAGLTQISGELGTGSQQTTFDAMSLFMSLLTDPFMGPGGGVTSPGGVMSFASNDPSAKLSPRERDAYAAVYGKAPPLADSFVGRWNVWTAGFGGSQTTDGNAVVGSNTVTSRIFGGAAGADYRFSPNTLAGFALAGGGTNFSLANGLGSGRSDLFQAGAYLHHREGAAYITAALAYGWQDITTDRIVTVAGFDKLHAEFNANAWSGRVEGGYRFAMPWMVGITPYAAAQFVTFDLPGYAESALVGTNNFALAYGAKTVTDPRTELGLRSDKSFAMPDSVLTLRGRLAWAHDYNSDRNIGATFQTLPGASFVVNGAAQAHDSALTTASAEVKWRSGWVAAATFEGEFSNVTQSYAGKAVVRYTW
jgi:autotransporter-associated beta strand protein